MSTLVPVSDLRHHPANPRRGDIEAIADSLTYHGQYRPIVVNRRTSEVLAGNHTLAAARKLGWSNIAAVYVDVEEEDARRIMLVDNRTADRASYDEELLLDILKGLPDLEGTGFDRADLDVLELGGSPGFGSSDDDAEPQVSLGPYRFAVDDDEWEAWMSVHLPPRRIDAIDWLNDQLAVPPKRDTVRAPQPSPKHETDDERVDVDTLSLWPTNPRDGDVGAIAESLATHGQYRPIVARRSDRKVLVGNHTLQAALTLGWETIVVTWVDADDDQAARIVLVDNRTSDLGRYDDDALLAALVSLPDLVGTGWDEDDVAAVAGGQGDGRPTVPRAGKRFVVGEVRWQLDRYQWGGWLDTLHDPNDVDTSCVDIAQRLKLPDGSWRMAE